MNRRGFLKRGTILAGYALAQPFNFNPQPFGGNPIRLGGPVPAGDPGEWAETHRKLGYSAAYCPVGPGAPSDLIKAYREAARKSGLIIAEAGAWNNLMDPDEKARKAAIEKNILCLALAEEIGARCCVNISGARGEKWDGAYKENYSDETREMIITNVRTIIDAVKPSTAFYTLEPMPYMLPDSPDSCLDLIKAVDRKQFGVHLDPVNMISSPQRYFNNAAFLRECFSKLGPHIRSMHAKDILLTQELTVHLEERRPGLGALDYSVFLECASVLRDIPFMMEHLASQEEYRLAADFIRETGKKAGIVFA